VLNLDPDLAERLKKMRLQPEDFEESFARSGGPGGQHVNKTSTSVTIIYRPLSLSVTARESRSQHRNRLIALHRLIARIAEQRKNAGAEKRSAFERERRRNSPRPRSLRREIRQTKVRRSELKRSRYKVEAGE
jgi:protein subunit release factor B